MRVHSYGDGSRICHKSRSNIQFKRNYLPKKSKKLLKFFYKTSEATSLYQLTIGQFANIA